MEFNTGHIAEGLDRLHIVMSTISDHLLDHPAVVEAGATGKLIEALSKLSDAYSSIGKLDVVTDRVVWQRDWCKRNGFDPTESAQYTTSQRVFEYRCNTQDIVYVPEGDV